MDICFGNKDGVSSIGKQYLGYLVRSVVISDTNELIEGPCKVVNKILELTGYASIIKELVRSATNSDSDFCPVPIDNKKFRLEQTSENNR